MRKPTITVVLVYNHPPRLDERRYRLISTSAESTAITKAMVRLKEKVEPELIASGYLDNDIKLMLNKMINDCKVSVI